MFSCLAQLMLFCAVIEAGSVSVESIYTGALADGSTVRVLRNVLIEQFQIEIEPTEHGGSLRGGDTRTDILIMLVQEPGQTHARHIAWTYSETIGWMGIDFIGQRRPTVEDIARRGESILILHVAKSEYRLAIVKRDPEPNSEWRTLESWQLDLSSLARGQNTVGLSGRIVQIDDKAYLYFWHSSLPGQIVFRIENDGVVAETDQDIIKSIIESRSVSEDE